MDLSSLRAELGDLESDVGLDVEANLDGRARAHDVVAFVDAVARARRGDEELIALKRRADALDDRLLAIDERVFRTVREYIRSRAHTAAELRRELDKFTAYSRDGQSRAHLGYDGLDVLLDGIMRRDAPPEAALTPYPEMVHYEPTPARVILDLVDHADLTGDDVFYDVGCGLGRVVMLVHLVTGIAARGVEYQPTFCSYARQCAQDLGLSGVDFVNADARAVDYSDGTVFYLFTPFKGRMLQAVLDQLRQKAGKRPITICTYGSCTRHVFSQPWVRGRDPSTNDDFKLAIFDSV
ncbi:MAG TPA: class I SAM-dependent methyltransferase [Chloroflexota bacterium]|nr:class I SAM-dependent methyltransferase [Chloroflexota bacterium]